MRIRNHKQIVPNKQTVTYNLPTTKKQTVTLKQAEGKQKLGAVNQAGFFATPIDGLGNPIWLAEGSPSSSHTISQQQF